MNILISGGTGFIGSNLIKKLSLTRHKLIILHRKKIKNPCKKNHKIEYIKVDILKNLVDQKKIPKFDTIIHIAGLSGGTNLKKDYLINEKLTYAMLSLMGKKVKKFIHISSQSVYGNPNLTNIVETNTLAPNFSPYSCSKVNSENWINTFQKDFNATFISLRFSGFIEGGGIIKYIKQQAKKNLPIELYSKGEIYRDYISINDGVDAICSSLKIKNSNSFIPLNIGSGQQHSIKELAFFVCKIVNSSSKIKLIQKPSPLGNLTLNIKKARKEIEYRPANVFQSIKHYVTKN